MNLRKLIPVSFVLFGTFPALAWNSTICVSSTTREITLTLSELGAKRLTNGNIKASFDDNEGEISNYFVRPSAKAGEYDVVLQHADPMADGIVGVNVSNENGSATYSFEFRTSGVSCSGAKISVR